MVTYVSRNGGARRAIATASVVLFAILGSVLVRPALGQTAPQQKYVISIGSQKLASGTLWLYASSYYGFKQLKLAVIENGVATVPLDVDRLKRETDPYPGTDAYLLVVQVGEHQWYRTPDIAPDRFWADLPGAIASLGNTTALPAGEVQLVLPPASRRRITLLYPDGWPKTDTDVNVSVFVAYHGHCGGHEGLPLGTFRTDAKGSIEVVAPLVPLYLGDLEYLENVGTGPAGVAYSENVGMKIGPEETVVIKKEWEFPSDSIVTVELQVLNLSGQPRPDVDIAGSWNTNTCGGQRGDSPDGCERNCTNRFGSDFHRVGSCWRSRRFC